MVEKRESTVHPTWLLATGQRWKLGVFQMLLYISGVLFVALILAVNDVPPFGRLSVVKLGLAQVAMGLTALFWLIYSIRCPKCNCKFAWTFISGGEHFDWWLRIQSAKICPCCSDRAI